MYESHLRSLFAKLLASAACVPAVLLGACEGPAMTSPDMSEPLAQPLPIRTVAATAGGPLCSPTTTLASPNLRLLNPAAYLEAGRFGAPCLLDGQGCVEGSITTLERRPMSEAEPSAPTPRCPRLPSPPDRCPARGLHRPRLLSVPLRRDDKRRHGASAHRCRDRRRCASADR